MAALIPSHALHDGTRLLFVTSGGGYVAEHPDGTCAGGRTRKAALTELRRRRSDRYHRDRVRCDPVRESV